MLVNSLMFQEDIKYPNDVELLNNVRKWLVGNIFKPIKKGLGIYLLILWQSVHHDNPYFLVCRLYIFSIK